MLTFALVLGLFAPDGGASAQSTLIQADCFSVKRKATEYFEEHDFYTEEDADRWKLVLNIGSRKDATLPSQQKLVLNRHTIRKYASPRHLSLFKNYDSFKALGHLVLVAEANGACQATLSFQLSAFEYVWAPVWDDGRRSIFFSNGALERIYLTSIGALFSATKQ